MSTISPIIPYRDVRAAVDFLCDAFAFERHELHEGDDGELAHVELRYGDAVVMPAPVQLRRAGPRADLRRRRRRRRPPRPREGARGDDHDRPARHRLRLARLRRGGPRRQRLVLRHVSPAGLSSRRPRAAHVLRSPDPRQPEHRHGRLRRGLGPPRRPLRAAGTLGDPRHRRRVAPRGAAQPDERLVDLGTGSGLVLRRLAGRPDRPREAVGVDRSPRMLAGVGELPAGWSALTGDARAVPLPDGWADVVTCAYVLQLLDAGARAAVLAEARRLLAPRPSSRLVVVTVWSRARARAACAGPSRACDAGGLRRPAPARSGGRPGARRVSRDAAGTPSTARLSVARGRRKARSTDLIA